MHAQTDSDETIFRDFEVYDINQTGQIKFKDIEEVLRQKKEDNLNFVEIEALLAERFFLSEKMIDVTKVEKHLKKLFPVGNEAA